MSFLYLLEKIRFPGLNELMLAVTRLGEETAFLVIALIFFWCVDKKKGYFIMAVGFLGTMANQFLKLMCRIPRPWVLDENFTILEQAREAADGYSFPSGHTQTAVGTFGAIAYGTEKRWLRITAIVLAVLVGFSCTYPCGCACRCRNGIAAGFSASPCDTRRKVWRHEDLIGGDDRIGCGLYLVCGAVPVPSGY